jgi:hypothetical protein
MKPNSSPLIRRAPWICAGGVAAVAVFLGLVLRFWHPVFGFTAFLQLGASADNAKIAAFRDRPIYVYPYPGSYDGVSYAQIAYHPLLNAPEMRSTIDNLAYRARRIVPPAIAWLIAGGTPGWIAPVYSLVNIAAWLILAALLWRLLAVRDGPTWLAWMGVLFSAGALASVRLALTDLVALAAIAASMLALERGRRGWSAGWMAVAGLSRETSLLALPGLWSTPDLNWPNVRRTLLAIAPLAVWIAYIRWQTGPADQGWGNFARPLSGFLKKWHAVLSDIRSSSDGLLAWTTLLATLGLTVQAAYFAVTARRHALLDPWWRIGVIYAALMLVLGPAVWDGYPGAATRVLLPLGLAFNVFACRRGAALVWLLAGNLTVPAGLLCMKDIPSNPREIAAAHSGGLSSLAQIDGGWNGVEHTMWHTKAWCSGVGKLEIETWPRDTRMLELEFTTRSLVPRTVVIRQANAVRWKGTVGPAYEPVTLSFEVTAGRAVLEFSTDSPGVREGSGDHTSVLAFNLRDPIIVH